jgi:hypothetical protein
MIKISLCIPTLRRFDDFLKENLERYTKSPWIDEIVICDEDGDDVQKICEHFSDEYLEKMVLITNEERLYAFRNKEKVVGYARNEWICLMDSDNYAPLSYFESWYSFVQKDGLKKDVVYMPIQTMESTKICDDDCGETKIGFDFTKYSNVRYEKSNMSQYDIEPMGCLFNTGNYIFHKSNYDTSEVEGTFSNLIENIYAVDVVFKNLLMLRKGSKFVIVPEMKYFHVVHQGSFFLNHEYISRQSLPTIYKLYSELSAA